MALVLAWISITIYVALIAIGAITLLIILLQVTNRNTRSKGLARLKVGLLGGLIATSMPFLYLLMLIPGALKFLTTVQDFLRAQVFGWSPYAPLWLGDFLIGFWIALPLWRLIRRVTDR